jgi:hypothetical protein
MKQMQPDQLGLVSFFYKRHYVSEVKKSKLKEEAVISHKQTSVHRPVNGYFDARNYKKVLQQITAKQLDDVKLYLPKTIP